MWYSPPVPTRSLSPWPRKSTDTRWYAPASPARTVLSQAQAFSRKPCSNTTVWSSAGSFAPHSSACSASPFGSATRRELRDSVGLTVGDHGAQRHVGDLRRHLLGAEAAGGGVPLAEPHRHAEDREGGHRRVQPLAQPALLLQLRHGGAHELEVGALSLRDDAAVLGPQELHVVDDQRGERALALVDRHAQCVLIHDLAQPLFVVAGRDRGLQRHLLDEVHAP